MGLLTALAIKEYLEARELRLVRRSVLAAEIVGLAVVGLIPLNEELDIVANSIVSFVAAIPPEVLASHPSKGSEGRLRRHW